MNVILQGYGKMGHNIENALNERGGADILGMVHPGLFERPQDVPGKADCLIDFSHPNNLANMLSFAMQTGCALVIGTTGYTDEQRNMIMEAAEYAPIVYSANYSLGVAIMKRAVKLIANELLPAGFDCEVIEKHHNQKADAPSGTAKALVDAIDPNFDCKRVFGREGFTGARGKEIGVHAVRGGNAAGEHTVMFIGQDEEIDVIHSATSRAIFAKGAVRAAFAICGKPNGLYTMDDILDM